MVHRLQVLRPRASTETRINSATHPDWIVTVIAGPDGFVQQSTSVGTVDETHFKWGSLCRTKGRRVRGWDSVLRPVSPRRKSRRTDILCVSGSRAAELPVQFTHIVPEFTPLPLVAYTLYVKEPSTNPCTEFCHWSHRVRQCHDEEKGCVPPHRVGPRTT